MPLNACNCSSNMMESVRQFEISCSILAQCFALARLGLRLGALQDVNAHLTSGLEVVLIKTRFMKVSGPWAYTTLTHEPMHPAADSDLMKMSR